MKNARFPSLEDFEYSGKVCSTIQDVEELFLNIIHFNGGRKMTNENKYQEIQDEYEKELFRLWQNVDAKIPRPDFHGAAVQYAYCRRELDNEFMKEFSALKHFDLQMSAKS